jgi:hypothetical protein
LHVLFLFGNRLYSNVPTVFFPMMWFEERATMTPDLAASLRLLLMLPAVGLYSALGILCLGIVVVATQILPRIVRSEKWTLPRRSKRYSEGKSDRAMPPAEQYAHCCFM